MKSYLFSITILIMNLGFSQASTDLVFQFNGKVVDKETYLPVPNAEIEIIGTDSSTTIVQTDSSGLFHSPLNKNTSYSISVYEPSYLKAKGKVTTISELKSKVFTHKYELQPIVTIHEGFLAIDFDSTFSLSPFNLNSDTITLFRKHVFVNKNEISYNLFRNGKNNYQLSNQFNTLAEKISIELIDTSMVKISNEKFERSYWVVGYLTKSKFWYNLIKIK